MKNVKITKCRLAIERGSFLTVTLELENGDGGLYQTCSPALYVDGNKHNHRCGNVGGEFITKLLQVCGVESFDCVEGVHVRLVHENATVKVLDVLHITKNIRLYEWKSHPDEVL